MLVTVAQPRARGGDACTSCRSSGSATSGHGAPNASRPDLYADDGATIGGQEQAVSATTASTPTASPSCCSATTTPTSGGCSASTGAAGLLQGRLPRVSWSAAGTDAVNPGAQRHQGRPPTTGSRSPARRQRALPPAPEPAACSPAPFADFDEVLEQRRAEADEFYAELQPDIDDADARSVQRQAFAGMIWSKQFFHYDVRALARGRPDPAAAAGIAPARPQQRMAAPQQLRHHLDAGQMGVSLVRGLGSGVPLHPARADRSRVRQAAARAADARVVHAPERPAAGLRVGVRRRQPAGARLGRLAGLPDRPQAARRRGRPRLPRARLPQAAAELHLVGEPQGRRRAATSSRAASSASTTSACSTARRRCRPAATSTRPTAPPGWRCTAST